MEHTYAVKGGKGEPVPGAIGPAELDGRADWVDVGRRGSLEEALSGRLGSEVDVRKVVLAVLCPLRQALQGRALDALLDRLAYPLAAEVRQGERQLGAAVPAPSGASDYLVSVSGFLQQPPARAAISVLAVFGAARAVLAREDLARVEAALPERLAELWRRAR